MKIKVTQEHIDRGDPRDYHRCALARAFKDAGCSGIAVISGVTGFFNGKWFCWNPPPRISNFIGRYDQYGRTAVAPFNFDFPIYELIGEDADAPVNAT